MFKMADDWDLPLGADARSISSKECKYDTWGNDYDSIHKTCNSIRNTVDSFPKKNNLIHSTVDNEYAGWIPAKTKSSRSKEAAMNSWKDEKPQFNEGRQNSSKHSQKKNKGKHNTRTNNRITWNAKDTNNHDTWNTKEANSYSSRDWNFTENSRYDQASAPVVNVWEQRIKRSEELKSMEPVNETEEEAMIRQAIELSKLEAQKNEENQKKLAKEYELQMQFLASNPEMVANISEDFVDISRNDSPNFRSSTTLYETSYSSKNMRKSEEVAVNTVYDKNEKTSMDYGGAKPKFGRIIDSFGGWGIKDVPKISSESNDCWGEFDRNNYAKTTERNSSSEHCINAKPQKKQSSCGGWGIKEDVVETPIQPTDSWEEPDGDNYGYKTEFNDCWEELDASNCDFKTESDDCWNVPDKNNYGCKTESNDCCSDLNEDKYDDETAEKACTSEKNVICKPLEKESEMKHHEDDTTIFSDLSSSKNSEEKNFKQNSNQYEKCLDSKSDFNSSPAKKVESLYSWHEMGKKNNSPEYCDINQEFISKDSDVPNLKTAMEFDEFMQELTRDSVEVSKEIEEKSPENSETLEDKKFVQLSCSKFESSSKLVDNHDTPKHETCYDFFSSDCFDSLTISKTDKYEVPSCSFPKTSNHPKASTGNTYDFLNSSNPTSISEPNHVSNDILNSSRYGDFQPSQRHEINTETNDVYNPLRSKMFSDPKQTLLEENSQFQAEDQTFSLPNNNFIPTEENPAAVHNIPGPYMMPNMPLGTPLMPVPMAFSPTFASPYTNPIMLQQMLMLNNPFFVKQLQALDMYYRSLGMPCSGTPFPSMQMPLQDPNFLASQSQVPIEREESVPHNIFPNENEVPKRRGVAPNPPGLNDFMQTEKQIGTMQQAEINSFLDKYCDNDFGDDIPPIPPPKPALTKCSDSSNLISESSAFDVASEDSFHIKSQSNVSVMHTNTKSPEDAILLKFKLNTIEKEQVGWGGLDNDSSARHQHKYMWNEDLDGWGDESTRKTEEKFLNRETKTKSMNRQPSSQPIVGRYKP